MNRNKTVQPAPQQQFRFNKVNTAPKNIVEQNGKRKIDNPPPLLPNPVVNGEHKKLKTDESSNENSPNGQIPETKKHLQMLNDLTLFHKVKVKYDVINESGPQHAKTFQVKCSIYNPETNVELESYVASGTSISKAKQSAAEIALSQTKLEKPTAEQIKKKRSEFNQERFNQTNNVNVYNEANPKPLMSLNLDEKTVVVKNQFCKPKFDKKRTFVEKKNATDPTHKKEIKPNSAAAAALAIANQSNKNPVSSTSASSPPVAAPAPAPVPPPVSIKSNVPPAPIPPQVPPNYAAYPGYPDPYTYQLYAQWQAQYYQQWQWAAMNQALNGAKQPVLPTSVPQPPPPPPPPPAH